NSSSKRCLLTSILLPSCIPYCGSFNTFWFNRLLVFFFTIVVNSYSNSYELVAVIAVVSC
ncbi:unnamed protein product, partial [Hymenolepis diminuta]